MIDSEDVINFLKNNPSFFEENPQLLADLEFSEVGNGALFYERQLRVLKERESRQQSKIDLIVDSARNNLQLESELLSVAITLLGEGEKQNPEEMVTALIKRQFNIKEVLILKGVSNGSDLHPQYDQMRQRVLHKSSVCDDRVSSQLLESLFHEESTGIASCAFVPLVYKSDITGVMILGSSSTDRFEPGAGVNFLDRLGQLIAGYLQGRID